MPDFRNLIIWTIEMVMMAFICAPVPLALFFWLRRIQRKEKRRLWQFHLSTSMVMMFATAALLLVNTQEHVDINWEPELVVKGWPSPMRPEREMWEVLQNSCIALSIILSIGISSELLILYRFRSSTTVVFMIAASTLLMVNSVDSHSSSHFYQNLERGWPFRFYISWTCHAEGLTYGSFWNLVLDGTIAVALLAASTFTFEWLIRTAIRLMKYA